MLIRYSFVGGENSSLLSWVLRGSWLSRWLFLWLLIRKNSRGCIFTPLCSRSSSRLNLISSISYLLIFSWNHLILWKMNTKWSKKIRIAMLNEWIWMIESVCVLLNLKVKNICFFYAISWLPWFGNFFSLSKKRVFRWSCTAGLRSKFLPSFTEYFIVIRLFCTYFSKKNKIFFIIFLKKGI